jgi:ABC-type transport system substrate-binding protein
VPVAAPTAPRGIKAPVVSAGPYYLKEWNEGRSALVVRNPFWRNQQKPFASFGFSNHLNEVRWLVGFLPATQRLQCESGDADICSFPPPQGNELMRKYGINKGRLFVKRSTTVGYLAMNTSRPPFSNPDLRKAVAHAIDRRFMVAQHGFLAGKPTDQLLPYSMPGFNEANIYSLRGPNYAKAKRLAQGNTGDGKAVLYSINFLPGPAIAQSIQFNLRQIGLDVEVKVFSPHVAIAKAGTRGEPFDLVFTLWSMDYPDPSNYINVLLDGRRIQAESNLNLSYFDNAKMNRAMDRAFALSGQARLDAYADLDIALMRDHAPVASYISTNTRILTSAKVGCYAFSPIYQSLLTQICTT